MGLLSALFKRPVQPGIYLCGPNGEYIRQTPRHGTGRAADGLPHCDRCRDGDLLSCMDPCSCGRMG